MSKLRIDRNGEFARKRIPESKRVCPLSCVEAATGRRIGKCHEGKIIGILTKLREKENETLEGLMTRKSKIVVELEDICPNFGECKLWGKCESRIRVIKDDDGEVIDKIPFPVKTISTSELGILTPTEFDSLKTRRRKNMKKRVNGVRNEDYVGNATKRSKNRGIKKAKFFRDADKKKVLI